MSPSRAAVLVVSLTLVFARQATADGDGKPDESNSDTTLRSHLGLSLAERWLQSGSAEDKLRALERLGTFGTPRALERLIGALEPAGEASSGAARLTAVRALAPHVQRPVVMQALVRVVAGVGGTQPSANAISLDELARQSAAMALADSQAPDAVRALGKALKSVGPAARAAGIALIAHPPRDLDPVLAARGRPTVEYVQVLAELGDQRAFAELRSLVRRGTTEVRAEAAWALTRLGDFETVPLAEQWLRPNAGKDLQLAAARILSLSRTDSAAAIRQLFAQNAPDIAVQLALQTPHRALVPTLLAELPAADSEQAARILAAIGRAGGASAVVALSRELAGGAHGSAAAYALARMPDAEAHDALARALDNPQSRRLSVRAWSVRKALLDDETDGVRTTAEALLASNNDSDRAAGAGALAVIDADALETLLRSRDTVVVRAAARALAWTSSRGALDAAKERLLVECDALTTVALSAALARKSVYENAPTRALMRLSESGGAAAPLASRALAARYTEALKSRIEALLASSDPWIRAHTALGLGKTTDPAALAFLSDAYKFELDADVRRAIVIALSEQSNPARRRVLELAAKLDPDQAVRSAARLALVGLSLREESTGHGAFWLDIRPSAGNDAAPVGHAVLVRTEAGLAVPLVGDPDGIVFATRLPEGPADVRVATAPQDDHACERTFGTPSHNRQTRQ